MRDATEDPHLWLMLLIAEVRQFSEDSVDRIAYDLARLRSSSETLIESLIVFLKLHETATDLGAFRDVVTVYFRRCDRELSQELADGDAAI